MNRRELLKASMLSAVAFATPFGMIKLLETEGERSFITYVCNNYDMADAIHIIKLYGFEECGGHMVIKFFIELVDANPVIRDTLKYKYEYSWAEKVEYMNSKDYKGKWSKKPGTGEDSDHVIQLNKEYKELRKRFKV